MGNPRPLSIVVLADIVSLAVMSLNIGLNEESVKYAILFLALALSVAALAYDGVLPVPIALWVAISFAGVSFAYATNNPVVLGKRPTGTMAWWSYSFYAPYLILTAIAWHLVRIISREPAWNRVDPLLTVGRRLLDSEPHPDCTVWLDLTSEFSEPRQVRQRPSYISLPILDAHVPNSDAFRRQLLPHLGEKIYVHCAQGHGRTGLVAAAILILREQAGSIPEAIELLRLARPRLTLNRTQTQWLKEYFNQPSAQ